MSAAGSLPYFSGIGGFLVDLAFAAISIGSTIHCRMSSADSFVPTPSSGFALLPLPAMAVADRALLRGVDLLPLLDRRRPAPLATDPARTRSAARPQRSTNSRSSSRRHSHACPPRCRSRERRTALPEIPNAEHDRVRGVRPVDVAHDQRAGLDDAVDHAGIEREVIDLQRLVEIRERRREVASSGDGARRCAAAAAC